MKYFIQKHKKRAKYKLSLKIKEADYVEFYKFIDSEIPNIRFTFEKEINHVISFLDVFIKVTPYSYDLIL